MQSTKSGGESQNRQDDPIGIEQFIEEHGLRPISGGSDAPAGGEGAAGGEGGTGGAPAAGAAEGWVATLDPELQKAPAVKKFKGKDWNEVGPQVLKSYVSLEKWQIPGEGATPEEKAAFARRLGVPEKPEGYDFGEVKLPEALEGQIDGDALKSQFSKFAHEVGLTPAQARIALAKYVEAAHQGVDAKTSSTGEALTKAIEGLKQQWGGAYQRNVNLVNRAVADYGSEEFKALLDTQVVDGVTLGNHPAMLEFLKGYGEQRLEAGLIPGDSLMTTSQDALAEANKILDDKNHPYWQGDKAAIKKVADLLAIAYPGKSA